MSNGARTARGRFQAALLCLPLLASCADTPPEAPPHRKRGTVGEEVFRVFCKRYSAQAFPDDLDGVAFNPACEGSGPIPEGRNDPHFSALIERRSKIVKALDEILQSKEGEKELHEDELRTFLGSLIPLYDPPSLMPESTRALANVLGRVLDDKDETGKKALDVLARTTGRVGYRPLKQALGVVRPLLEYPGLDDFIQSSLQLVAKGGKAEKEYDAVIHGLSLELATYEDTPLAPDSTLILTRDLMFNDLTETLKADLVGNPLQLVRRDDRGVAVPLREPGAPLPAPFIDEDGDDRADIDGFGRLRSMPGGPAQIPAPFAVRNEAPTERDSVTGLAKNVWDGSNKPLFNHADMNATLLASLLREQINLIKVHKGDRTTFEKMGRGAPALLGLTGQRVREYGKAKIAFEGPDPATAPILDLVHAFSSIAGKPETKKALEVIRQTMERPELEPATAQLIQTLLNIKARADMHPEAQLVGKDGPGTPSRFWDDMIDVARRMVVPITYKAKNGTMQTGVRAGLIEAVMRSILDEDEPGDEPGPPMKPDPNDPSQSIPDQWNPPCEGVCAPAQGKLLANWLRHRDVVTYPNSPSQDFADINGRAKSTECKEPGKAYCVEVDRSMPDHGFNRSIFQRVLGMVYGLNGQTQMNKDGARISDPLPLPLDLNPFDGVQNSWKPGELFTVPDMVEVHILAVLNKSHIGLKDGLISTVSGLCNILGITAFNGLACIGATQEKNSGILGFDDTPSPESLARFVFNEPNAFVSGISDPVTVKGGAPIRVWEPLALYPMEVIDPEAKPLGAPDHPGLTFIQAGRSLMKAFNEHEIRDTTADPKDYPLGALGDHFLFGDLLSTLHMHWSSRSSDNCFGPPQNTETCTQSLDPNAPFYNYQSDLRSYEPLIAEAMDDERLLEVLYDATKALKSIQVDGEDGITILAKFVELLIRPMDGLTYRDGRTTALTNLGDEVGYVSPLYLLLDALNAIDKSFAAPEHKDRLATWREARSEFVDTVLAIDEDANGNKRMADRLGRAVSIHMIKFAQDRIAAHEAAGDLDEWTASFVPRLIDVLDRPVVGAVLKLLDKTWEDKKAGAEFAKLTKYLFEEEGPGFAVSLLASGDLLQLLDDVTAIAPLLDLAAEAVAPGVTNSVDVTGKEFLIDGGLARKMVELQAAIIDIDTKRPSTTAKLLRNLVNDMGDGYTPLETLLDAIAEIERVDPKKPSDAPLDRADLEAVLTSVHHFMTDEEHGLERLYAVIEHRKREVGE
jgi:hypothetical protein